jgi:hypothetical protein
MIHAARCAVIVAVAAWAFSAAAQSPEDLLKGSKSEIENKACCGPSGGATVRNPDAAVLAKLSGMASRDGGTLRLKLAGERALKLVDCLNPACDGEDLRMHRLVAWWPTQRIYVVSVALYEDSVAYLVQERDGRALVVTAPPVLSPSGRQAIALTSNLMAGVELQLIDLSRDPPTITKIETMPSCAGSSDSSMLRPKLVWIDDSHVRFEGVSPAPGDNPNTKQLLRIEGGKAAWEC